MITFIPLETTTKVLRIINNCIKEMIDNELFYFNLSKDTDEEKIDYLMHFFPKHLCREEPQKCINALHDLLEWSQDSFFHDLTCIHEYALFKIFGSFFDEKEDYEKIRNKGEKHIYDFRIKDIENYEPDEIYILKQINDRSFYEEDLFWDLDFLWIDDIVNLYQTDRKLFNSLGVNLRYYLDIMPKDIREEIEFSLDKKIIEDDTEKFVIKQISNVIKQMEMNPIRLEKCNENEISDDIKDRMQFALEMENITIEREARGGFAKKEIGEIDFFLYQNNNHQYTQLALGENKVWGNFENQLKQLLGYLNKNIRFGFTIVINKDNTCEQIKNSQKKILENFNLNGEFKVINIEEKDNIVISTHTIPEEDRPFKIYHFIINLNTKVRRNMAQQARRNIKNTPHTQTISNAKNNKVNSKVIIDYIIDKIKAQPLKFEDMLDILNKFKSVVYEEEANELINEFKKIRRNKRNKSKLIVDNKKYNNIQIFNDKDSPIMGFLEKITKFQDKVSIYMAIDKTINQYKTLDNNNEYVIKDEYIRKALEVVQKKYNILDLLADKKIDIFILNKGQEKLKSYLYKDLYNNTFEIFIYTDKDAIYTLLYQLGSILNLILCNEDEAVPKDFIKVNKKIKVNLLETTKIERKIIFSDIFAITALKNTDLEMFAPFVLENDANKTLEEYFIKEIQKELKNKE